MTSAEYALCAIPPYAPNPSYGDGAFNSTRTRDAVNLVHCHCNSVTRASGVGRNSEAYCADPHDVGGIRALRYSALRALHESAQRPSRRSDRAFTSSLSCRTISVVLRMSGWLSARPMVDATERRRALNSR